MFRDLVRCWTLSQTNNSTFHPTLLSIRSLPNFNDRRCKNVNMSHGTQPCSSVLDLFLSRCAHGPFTLDSESTMICIIIITSFINYYERLL